MRKMIILKVYEEDDDLKYMRKMMILKVYEEDDDT